MTKIEGADRLKRRLERLASINGPVRRRVREALQQNGAEITAQMKAVVPRDSGDLANSIKAVFGTYQVANANVRGVSTTGGGAGDPDLTLHIVAGDEKAWYARIVEFGTKEPRTVKRYFGNANQTVTVGAMPAKPFFFPVYRANKRRAKGRITRAMKAGFREASGG
jgi:HK97 gp10 family phage protein